MLCVLITEDKPLVVQFAAKNATDFADASELVYKYYKLWQTLTRLDKQKQSC